MADETDEVTEMRVRERLRRTDIEIKGNLRVPVKGRLTEEGLNMLMDALSVGGFKFVKK